MGVTRNGRASGEERGRPRLDRVAGRGIPAARMLSGGPDGQRVEVVGEDAPGDPGAGTGMALEAAAAEAVAALEVADATLAADAVARQAPVAAPGPRGLAAGDERVPAGGQMLGDWTGREATVDGDILRPEA